MNSRLRGLFQVAALLALLAVALLLLHSTACDGDHGRCQLCLLAKTMLPVTLALGLTWALVRKGLLTAEPTRVISERALPTGSIRAPPVHS